MKSQPGRISKIPKVSLEEERGELIGSVSILTPPLGIGRTAQFPQPTLHSLSEEYIPTHIWLIPESPNTLRRNQRIYSIVMTGDNSVKGTEVPSITKDVEWTAEIEEEA